MTGEPARRSDLNSHVLADTQCFRHGRLLETLTRHLCRDVSRTHSRRHRSLCCGIDGGSGRGCLEGAVVGTGVFRGLLDHDRRETYRVRVRLVLVLDVVLHIAGRGRADQGRSPRLVRATFGSNDGSAKKADVRVHLAGALLGRQELVCARAPKRRSSSDWSARRLRARRICHTGPRRSSARGWRAARARRPRGG